APGRRPHRACRGGSAGSSRGGQVPPRPRRGRRIRLRPPGPGGSLPEGRTQAGRRDTMGAVYDEFVLELAGWRRRYAGRPREEMVRLFLLALEREEIVAVGYREAAIARRLAAMPLAPEVRDLIRHALLWVWKDEEMHALYIRGALRHLGTLRLRLMARLRQMAGAVGGWSTSVRHHARWREAPLARALATLNTWAGSLLGKIPADVRRHLRYGPFRDFCLFNVDAEQTAWLCWGRIAELAEAQPGVDSRLVE